jgi:hypothetical protein
LTLTAKEALSHLVDVHSELTLTARGGLISADIIKRDVDYVSNLIEQINLLQTMSHHPVMTESETEINCLQVIKDQVAELEAPIEKKGIKIDIDQTSMATHFPKGNTWLFAHGVVRNLLTEAILMAENKSTLSLSCGGQGSVRYLNLHLSKCYGPNNQIEGLNLGRRIEVIQRTLVLYQGKLIVERDHQSALTLRSISTLDELSFCLVILGFV